MTAAGSADPSAYRGRVEHHPLESEVLRGNALGDPSRRDLLVYVPPGEHAELPVVLLLTGLTGHATKLFSVHPWKPGVVQQFDRAVAEGRAAPAILAAPDCFTELGGSQYVNSSATGRYEDYVVDEVLPHLAANLPARADRIGVMGVSSGGFGALHLSMHHPDRFSACASISGDCCFEACFGHELLLALRGLVPHDLDPAKFLAAFRETHELSGNAHAVLNVLAMSACYSPAPDAPLGFDLPMSLDTGERDEEVWRRWLAFDPLHAAREHVDALRGLELLYLEAGLADEFSLQWGLRRLVRVLAELDVPHEHVEHAGGHMGLDHRWVPILERMSRVLAEPRA